MKNHNRSWNCSYNKLILEQALVTLHGLLVSSMDILTCKSTHLVFLLMLLVLCPFFHSSHAAGHTISQGQSITITETIVSADAKFELGFFRPGTPHINTWELVQKGFTANCHMGSQPKSSYGQFFCSSHY